MRLKRRCLLTIVCLTVVITTTAQTYSSPNPKVNTAYNVDDMIHLDYSALYKLSRDLSSGIMGPGTGASASGNVTMKVFPYDPSRTNGKGDQIFYIYATPADLVLSTNANKYLKRTDDVYYASYMDITGVAVTKYTKSDNIKEIATQRKIYYPGECATQLSGFTWFMRAVSRVWGEHPPLCATYVSGVQPVIIEIYTPRADLFVKGKIPGVGEVSISSPNKVIKIDQGGGMDTYCDNNPTTALCALYSKIRNPTYSSSTEDIYVAMHRGYWGNNLGTGEPENTVEAMTDGFGSFSTLPKIVEMDITSVADNELMMMHDYVMKRLSNYTGEKYSFDLRSDEVEKFYARRRDEVVSQRRISRFKNVLTALPSDGIVMLDIKEQQKKMSGSTCVENCKANSEESWRFITERAIAAAHEVNRSRQIVMKTYKSFDEIHRLIGDDVYKVMWTPMIVSTASQYGNDIQKMCSFIDDWQAEFPNGVFCFETDFFAPTDVMLKSFSRGGVTYVNILDYIYKKTKRRSGIFSEDPVAARGTVNRWGDWKVKDPKNDMRGDPLQLLTIPYGNIMVITTDRIDVWKSIKDTF